MSDQPDAERMPSEILPRTRQPGSTVVYGGGGLAREVAWLLRSVLPKTQRPIAMIDDALERQGSLVGGLPVLSLDEAAFRFPAASYVVGIADPSVRRRASASADVLGLVALPALVHASVSYDATTVRMGDGTFVCAGTILTVDIELGRHVCINLDCTVGHDANIEDFVTVAPGVHISGRVTIESGASIGTGAVIRQGLTIGRGAIVGMGSVVTKDVPPGEVWYGCPASRRIV